MSTEPLYPGAIGAPCTTDASCAGEPVVCVAATSNTEFQLGGPQGGYCSVPCTTNADCTAIDDASACNTGLGYCFALCFPGSSPLKCGSDRAQVCVPISDDGLGACLPRCTSDAACGEGRFCDPGDLGLCVDEAPTAGGVGAPCTPETEATDCANGFCAQYGSNENPIGRFCTANCTYGLIDGCGTDGISGGVRQAACLQPQDLVEGQPGDLGFCFPLCDTDADCAQNDAGWVCDLFGDPNAEALLGRRGECLPAALVDGGAADAGPG